MVPNRLFGPASRVSTVNALNFRIIKRTLFAELRNTVAARNRVGRCGATARILWDIRGRRTEEAVRASQRQRLVLPLLRIGVSTFSGNASAPVLNFRLFSSGRCSHFYSVHSR